jgi:hypothetical protein
MKSKVLVEIIVDHPKNKYQGNTRKLIEKHIKQLLSVGIKNELSSINYDDLEVKILIPNSEILKKRDPLEEEDYGTTETQK